MYQLLTFNRTNKCFYVKDDTNGNIYFCNPEDPTLLELELQHPEVDVSQQGFQNAINVNLDSPHDVLKYISAINSHIMHFTYSFVF